MRFNNSANTPSSRLTDFGLAGLVVAVVVMMALPLPPWSLDILVAVSIAIGVVLLLVSMFVPTPLAFSSFPAVLLISTLFRIALSVATTRQILLTGHAGDIISAFGRLVVGGSLVVGLVVFLIITVVQFIVIAKGAERVAEVGARFTLDALPGKQMSIDADVRAGLVSQKEAVARRRELIDESQFHGAMDGAMKFVKGDAIAGILIVLVNLLGGITIGTLSMGLSMAEAVHKFSVLSIGDGLVAQIPALFVAISAAIVSTRGAPDETSSHLGIQIGRQLSGQPRALLLSAGVLALFALVPGFPALTFLVLAILLALAAKALERRQESESRSRAGLEVAGAAREGEAAPMLLSTDRPRDAPSAFRIELSPAMAKRLGASAISEALKTERRLLREQYGVPFPGVVLQIVEGLSEDGFRILVQDLTDGAYTLPEGAALALGHVVNGPAALAHDAPSLLSPCRWIAAGDAEAATQAGLEVLPADRVLARLLMRTLQKNASAVFGVQEVRQLIREIELRFADLVREAQAVLPLPRIADLMAALARERVPLTDVPALLQALVTNAPGNDDKSVLYEEIRMALARSIVARQLPPGADRLPAVVLDTELEARLRAMLVVRPDGPVLSLPPEQAEETRQALQAAFPRDGRAAALVVPADLRRAVSRLFRSSLPGVTFISLDELAAVGVGTEQVVVVKAERAG
jgi:type III secretion protein V